MSRDGQFFDQDEDGSPARRGPAPGRGPDGATPKETLGPAPSGRERLGSRRRSPVLPLPPSGRRPLNPRRKLDPSGAGPSGAEGLVPVSVPVSRPRPRPIRPSPSPSPSSSSSSAPSSALGRSTAVLAAGTFLSRLTGFARVSVAAFVLGLYGIGNAYNIANSIPNIIYDLLLGGILSATLIPVFVDEFRRDDTEGRDRAVSAILTLAGAVLVVLTIALYVLAPLVIHLYLVLNHHTGKGDELAIGVSLLRFFAPQVFFLGAIVIGTALLNARRKFATAAFAPVVNNVIAIAALITTRLVAPTVDPAVFRHSHRGLAVLGVGTTLGYVVQFLVQLPAMARTGIRFRPVWAPRHPAVRRVIGLSAWLLGVVVANQIAYNLIVVISAGTNGSNDFAAYQTAYQLFQLPYALLAVSIASAIMPDLAERWAARQWTAFLARVIRGLRVTLALLVPAAVGYAFVAAPVVDLGLRHFQVSAASATVISQSLAVFALGLPGFSAFLLLVRALQAMKDARTMFAIYAAENALTVVLAIALYPRFGDRGLAAAFVGPYTLAAIVAAVYLHRRVGALGGIYTARAMVRTVLATAVMAAVLFALGRLLPAGSGDAMLSLRLAVEVVAGSLVFLRVAHWLGIDDLQPVLQPIRAALGRAHLIRAGSD